MKTAFMLQKIYKKFTATYTVYIIQCTFYTTTNALQMCNKYLQ